MVALSGSCLQQHRNEFLNLARHQEQIEKSEHPLNRIMNMEEAPDHIVINTTDIHLPRRISEACKSVFDGDLHFSYDEGGYFIRVDWHRDA